MNVCVYMYTHLICVYVHKYGEATWTNKASYINVALGYLSGFEDGPPLLKKVHTRIRLFEFHSFSHTIPGVAVFVYPSY